MVRATALEIQRKFGEYQSHAQREPVEITRHGRREWVLLSADHYDWLTASAKRVQTTQDAAAIVVEAVRKSEMDNAYAELDELLK